MTRFSCRRVAALLVVLLPGCTGAQGRAAAADFGARVDSVFARWSTDSTPGCAVGVARSGRTVLARAYGMANLEYGVRNTPETIFEAGSVAKQFTAAAIVLLAAQGKLSLDDDVRRYLPQLPDYGTTITIRHMLNHTSGLRDWGTVVSAAGWPRGTRVHTHAHVLDVISRQRALNFEPGSEYLYSNTGYNLLAIIVERVSGQSFAAFTSQQIFAPLGMARTQWRDDYTRVVKGRATAYAGERDGFRSDMPFENVHGNGGLLTTIGDLLRWNENFVDPTVGGRALSDSLQRRGRLTSGREIEYALGVRVAKHHGFPEISHTGSTAGYRATLLRYPEQHLSVALLCNVDAVNPGIAARSVADIFLGWKPATSAAVAAVRLPRRELERRTGIYRDVRTGEPLRLVLRDSMLELEDGPRLVAIGSSTFRTEDGATRVEFVRARNDPSPAMIVVEANGDTSRLEPASAVNPSAKELAEYTGEYHSEEAEATLTFELRGDSLVLRRRPNLARALVPAYADAFTAPGVGLLRFIRDSRGRVSAVSLGLGRVRDLRFLRVAGSG